MSQRIKQSCMCILKELMHGNDLRCDVAEMIQLQDVQ